MGPWHVLLQGEGPFPAIHVRNSLQGLTHERLIFGLQTPLNPDWKNSQYQEYEHREFGIDVFKTPQSLLHAWLPRHLKQYVLFCTHFTYGDTANKQTE